MTAETDMALRSAWSCEPTRIWRSTEKTNLQFAHPEIVRRLTALLESYRKTGRSR